MSTAGRRAHILDGAGKVRCGLRLTKRTAIITFELAQIRLQRGVGQQACAKCLKVAIAEFAKEAAPRLEHVELPLMADAPRTWSWPAPMHEVRDVMLAIRGGFTIVELRQPDTAAPSAEPVYRLRRDGREAPTTILSPKHITIARRRGLIEHDEANRHADGALPFKLGPLA